MRKRQKGRVRAARNQAALIQMGGCLFNFFELVARCVVVSGALMRGVAGVKSALEKSSRCLLCSSTGHPKPRQENGGTQKGDRRVAKVLDKKGQKSTEKESQKESIPPVKEAAEENPQPEKRSEGSQPKQESDLVQNLNGQVKSMTSIKSVFIKTVKVDEECGAEYALLDGGATHALRQAKSSEIPYLWPVQVEMAMGSVTLYRCAAHNTLLALLDMRLSNISVHV